MTKLDERNGWHVVAEGDMPDNTKDVWIIWSGMNGDRENLLSWIAYHNGKDWWWSRDDERIGFTVLLWHEIERPEIPLALAIVGGGMR